MEFEEGDDIDRVTDCFANMNSIACNLLKATAVSNTVSAVRLASYHMVMLTVI